MPWRRYKQQLIPSRNRERITLISIFDFDRCLNPLLNEISLHGFWEGSEGLIGCTEAGSDIPDPASFEFVDDLTHLTGLLYSLPGKSLPRKFEYNGDTF
jgi:hypothetical protein